MAPKLKTIFEDDALEDDSQKTLTPFEFATSISSDSDVDGMPLPASKRPSMTATPMMLAKEKAPPKAEVVDEGHPGHDKWSGPPDPDISQVAEAVIKDQPSPKKARIHVEADAAAGASVQAGQVVQESQVKEDVIEAASASGSREPPASATPKTTNF